MNGVILLRSPNLHGTLLCLLKRCDAESYQVIEGREREGGRGRGKKNEGGREGGREGRSWKKRGRGTDNWGER